MLQCLLQGYRVLTCDALPPPRFLTSMFTERSSSTITAAATADASNPAVWREMEQRLERAGQLHVMMPSPPIEKRAAFFAQLRSLDLDGLPSLLKSSLANVQTLADKKVEPFRAERLADLPETEAAALRERGLGMIARGEVAALLLAGGQGTRLGTSLPKGCYDIGLPSGKSLFQYHSERIRKVMQLAAHHAGKPEADVRLPFLVMTSDATDAETRAFFRRHGFFGLPEAQVHFFAQGALPCLTKEGKLMLDAPGVLAMAPNGNGGCYVSLRDSGLLAELARSGVTSIFQFGVDNILCHVADPTFVGFCASREADCASKTVPKRDAHEPVGVVALAGGKPAVVEYSEISREMAEATDASGRLLFGDAHICVNFFSVPFLQSFCAKLGGFNNVKLPLHVAHKKIPFVDASGTRQVPTANNGVKLELFIFDTFPHAKRMAALQVPRDDEFAPVKNAPGAKAGDSPDTARQLISALGKRRIASAGGRVMVAGGHVGAADPVVEISPLLSYQGEGLAERVGGRTLTAPVHLEVQPRV